MFYKNKRTSVWLVFNATIKTWGKKKEKQKKKYCEPLINGRADILLF